MKNRTEKFLYLAFKFVRIKFNLLKSILMKNQNFNSAPTPNCFEIRNVNFKSKTKATTANHKLAYI
jgi:hypothetical protein